MDNKDELTFKIKGDLAKQVSDMKRDLGLTSEMDVMKWGLSLLYYAMGREVKITDKNTKQEFVFDQFKDKKPKV